MCRLDIIWEGYCHNSMDHLVEETKAGISPSLLKGSPAALEDSLSIYSLYYGQRRKKTCLWGCA